MEIVIGSIIFIILYGLATVGVKQTKQDLSDTRDIVDSAVDRYIAKCEAYVPMKDR